MTVIQPMPRSNMLIIDNETDFAERLADLFRDAFSVRIDNQQVDIDEICDAKLDIIIINRDIPENFGVELFARMKTIPELMYVPVIFLSSSTDPQTEEAAINLGAADFLNISVDSNVLRARVNSCLLMKRKIERLSFLTTIDGVTRLANRRLFNQYLAREWARAVRLQRTIAVVALELTGLGDVILKFGESVSDRCLTHLARVVERCLHRPGDFPARYVDNKILIILPDTDSIGARLVVDKINASFSESIGDVLSQNAVKCLDICSGLDSIKPDRSNSSSTFIRGVMTELNQSRKEIEPSETLVNL